MLEALGAKLALGFAWSKAKAISGWSAMSPKMHLYIIGAVAAVLAFIGHQLYAHHQLKTQYELGLKKGHADQFAHDQAEMDKVRAQARAFKQQADKANTLIHNQEKAIHDAQVARNHALADALRMRVRTSAQPSRGGVANLSGSAGARVAAGGSQPPADAGLGSGADRPLVCVDVNQLIDYAEQADDDYDALVKQEDAQKKYQQHWPSTTAQPPSQ